MGAAFDGRGGELDVVARQGARDGPLQVGHRLVVVRQRPHLDSARLREFSLPLQDKESRREAGGKLLFLTCELLLGILACGAGCLHAQPGGMHGLVGVAHFSLDRQHLPPPLLINLAASGQCAPEVGLSRAVAQRETEVDPDAPRRERVAEQGAERGEVAADEIGIYIDRSRHSVFIDSDGVRPGETCGSVGGDQVNLQQGLVAEELSINPADLLLKREGFDFGPVCQGQLDRVRHGERDRLNLEGFGRNDPGRPEVVGRALDSQRLERVLGLRHHLHRLKDLLAVGLDLRRGRDDVNRRQRPYLDLALVVSELRHRQIECVALNLLVAHGEGEVPVGVLHGVDDLYHLLAELRVRDVEPSTRNPDLMPVGIVPEVPQQRLREARRETRVIRGGQVGSIRCDARVIEVNLEEAAGLLDILRESEVVGEGVGLDEVLQGAAEPEGVRCLLRVIKDRRSGQRVISALCGEKVELRDPHVLAIDFDVRVLLQGRQNRVLHHPLHGLARLNALKLVGHFL